RGATVPGINATGVEAAFTANKGDAGQAEGAQAGQRVVYVVTDVMERKIDLASAQPKELRDNVQKTAAGEQLNQFIAKLEQDLGAQINATAFAQATGAQS